MDEKVKIHEFDPVIYPVKLWVSITENLYEISNRFLQHPSKEEIDINKPKSWVAHTEMVEQKEGELFIGVIIVFYKLKYVDIRTIAHESTHAARALWDKLGEAETGIEADAYLVGWIADCINKVLKNKR